jgi:hypothetical protein
MDSKRIFEHRNKLYENIDKDLMDSSNQRIENKLSLRKQKVNDIIQKKRLLGYNLTINNNEIKSKWKLLIFDRWHKIFSDEIFHKKQYS